MTQKQHTFNTAIVASNLKSIFFELDQLLAKDNNSLVFRKKLHEGLKNYREQGVLGVAFVGQYSAGKSTIISALTGRRDIHIDADIATDKTTSYDWNAVKLIDTPGLFTDRQDHDEITYKAINKADLLVFCLTYMLFDSVTAENFKKLAYEKGYRWKMMLVINKMSDEAGEEEQKIANYRQSLAEAIKPHKLDDFPICFIDAKDYCEGVDENEDFLLEVSRFTTFIDEVNKFVDERAILAGFDGPVRIALSCLDEAQLNFARNSSEDTAFLEVISRLSRTTRRERERLQINIRKIALELSAAVVQEGTVLADAIGGKEDINVLAKKAENNVQHHYEQFGDKLAEVIEISVESLRDEIKEVLDSDLTQAFFARSQFNPKFSAHQLESNIDSERLMNQFKQLKNIGETVASTLTNLAQGRVAVVAGEGALKASNVAGSSLHHGVYAIGKLVGFDFQPWQAVHIAKDIANVATVVGPILGVVGLVMDHNKIKEEEERDRKLAKARSATTSEFIMIAKNLESQIELQRQEIEAKIYGEVEQQIAAARQQEEEAIAISNKWVKQLLKIRKDFEAVFQDITKIA